MAADQLIAAGVGIFVERDRLASNQRDVAEPCLNGWSDGCAEPSFVDDLLACHDPGNRTDFSFSSLLDIIERTRRCV